MDMKKTTQQWMFPCSLLAEFFANVRKWLKEINSSESVEKILIGNKCDLVNERRVSYEDAKEMADDMGISYLETSAKSSTNVSESFLNLATTVKENL